MGAAQAKSVTKEVTKSDKQRNNEFNMYTIAPEGFMCKTNNMPKDNNIPTITDIIIYFLILFTIIFISYLLYNGVIK
jgi:hypothetical protein